jgi:hypothetical protein
MLMSTTELASEEVVVRLYLRRVSTPCHEVIHSYVRAQPPSILALTKKQKLDNALAESN